MKPLFSHWEEVQDRLALPDRVLWLFDFDGTLVPIVKHPNGAVLRPAMRRLLKKLSRRFPGRVGILSGRSIKHLRQKVGIGGLIYGGTHGFEIEGEGWSWKHPFPPVRKRRFRAWIHEQEQAAKDLPGLWIEKKGWTACLHFRDVRPRDGRRLESLRRKICNQSRRLGFKVQEGIKSLELYSDRHWNKGKAARRLKKRCGVGVVFYAGDDQTDETVFRALGRSDVTVRIQPDRASRARYGLRRQSEFEGLLRRILKL